MRKLRVLLFCVTQLAIDNQAMAGSDTAHMDFLTPAATALCHKLLEIFDSPGHPKSQFEKSTKFADEDGVFAPQLWAKYLFDMAPITPDTCLTYR